MLCNMKLRCIGSCGVPKALRVVWIPMTDLALMKSRRELNLAYLEIALKHTLNKHSRETLHNFSSNIPDRKSVV